MTAPVFPQPLDDDDDDVAWALQTGHVEWRRGAWADALVWLGRAADTADRIGKIWRAADLRREAQELTARVATAALSPSKRPPAGPAEPSAADVDELLGDPNVNDGLDSIPAALSDEAPTLAFGSAALATLRETDAIEVDFDAEITELDPDSITADMEPAELARALREAAVTEDLGDDIIAEELDSDLIAVVVDARAETPVRLEDAAKVEAAPTKRSVPKLGEVLLSEVPGLEDLPLDAQLSLVERAHLLTLNGQEEVNAFGLALVLRGRVSVMPAIADAACAHAARGELIWSRGSLDDSVALRLVSVEHGTEVALWEGDVFAAIIRDCPWVADELRPRADRLQALAGVSVGVLGDRLDDELRAIITDRCQVRVLVRGEELVHEGKPLGGMHIVAGGHLELALGDPRVPTGEQLGPGEFLFAPQVLSSGPAPASARAGRGGALILFADRHVAHELLVSVPPLLDLLSS
jgi:Cyclic nucleotide-binding domain